MLYDVDDIVSTARINRGFGRAHDEALVLLVRLDERLLRADPELRAGVEARLDLQEAQSLVGLGGGFLHLNDLVLFDADTNNLVPTEDSAKARRFLAKRRALRRLAPKEMLAAETLSKLTGLAGLAFDPDQEHGDESHETIEGLEDIEAQLGGADQSQRAFTSVLARAGRYPALFAALLLFDHWRMHEDDSVTEIGPFLVAACLRSRGLVRSHLPGMASGLWRQSPKWQRGMEPGERLSRAAAALAASAQKTMLEMDRLTLGRESLRRKLPESQQAQDGSTLAALINLFVAEPLVTVDLAARRLKLTPQAVEYQLKKLGSALPREMTGRKRYRAWGL